MKLLAVIGLVNLALAETAQFTNTSFAGPFTVGQTIPLMWTVGNGLPIKLSLYNSSWSSVVFDGRSVLPTTYEWKVNVPGGFMSGNYQLALDQLNGGSNNSSSFRVIFSNASQTSTSTSSVSGMTTMTSSTMGSSMTTVTWWDDNCGCHKSTAYPTVTQSAGNNYTIPAVPPVVSTTTTSNSVPMLTATASATQSTFTGGASQPARARFEMVLLAAISAFVLF